MIGFQTSIRIERPVDDVFGYVCDLRNLPAWNSAVRSVLPTGTGRAGGAGATYSMRRDLPGGPAENRLEIASVRPPAELTIRTTSGPTPFVYRLELAASGGTTILRIDGEVDLGGAGRLLGPLAQRAVRGGVDTNLATLKRLLEGTGRTRAA